MCLIILQQGKNILFVNKFIDRLYMKLIAQVSSPAKAILCGQHAVVYGQDAIAFAVNLRCYADIFTIIASPQQKKQVNPLQIYLNNKEKPQKVQYFKRSYDICKKIADSQSQMSSDFKSAEVSLDYQKFQQIFNKECSSLIHQKQEHVVTINFKISLFFLMYEINPYNNDSKNIFIQITSQIPIGKCLGSSASFNTVLASSLLIIFYKVIKKFEKQFLQKFKDSEDFKQQVNLISKLFQRVEHGNPSGIDNYVSVFGGLVQYNRVKQPKFLRLKDQNVLKRLTQQLIIGFEDSQIPKNTKQAVFNVRQKYMLYESGNQKYKKMIQQIGTISRQVLQILSSQQNWIQKLFFQIQKNHILLKQLGLSNQKIELIVEKNTQKGKICSKITGSGMGGFVLILSIKENQQQFLKDKEGVLISKISKEGLLIKLLQ